MNKVPLVFKKIKMKRHLISIILLFCGVVNFVSAQSRADSLMAALSDDKSEKVFVVSHRGDWRNALRILCRQYRTA